MQLSFSDLSPNYAGTLFGIGNALACIGGFGAPYVTGMVTQEEARKTIKGAAASHNVYKTFSFRARTKPGKSSSFWAPQSG
jgi:hypothetical protein